MCLTTVPSALHGRWLCDTVGIPFPLSFVCNEWQVFSDTLGCWYLVLVEVWTVRFILIWGHGWPGVVRDGLGCPRASSMSYK